MLRVPLVVFITPATVAPPVVTVSPQFPVVVVTVLSMVVTPSAVMVTVPEVAEMGWLVSSPAAESRTTLPAVEVISSETESY